MNSEKESGYKKGTSFIDALLDGWARDLPLVQRVEELSELGFYVNKVFLLLFNENMNKEMNKNNSQIKSLV